MCIRDRSWCWLPKTILVLILVLVLSVNIPAGTSAVSPLSSPACHLNRQADIMPGIFLRAMALLLTCQCRPSVCHSGHSTLLSASILQRLYRGRHRKSHMQLADHACSYRDPPLLWGLYSSLWALPGSHTCSSQITVVLPVTPLFCRACAPPSWTLPGSHT